MNCFMFPGQPLARCASLPDDADFAQIAQLVQKLARFDLQNLAWLSAEEGTGEGNGEGTEEGTENLGLQLYGVALSLYRLRRLRLDGVQPDLVAEHSMGIYPALVACGSLSEPDAIEITWRIGAALARMAKTQQYALGCVLGLRAEQVQIIADHNRLHVANHNTSRHFLLSGTSADMAAAVLEAVDAGAFTARFFHYDAPLHTPPIERLEGEIVEILADYRFAEPLCPLINHLDQGSLRAREIPKFLLRELSRPVYWEKTYRALRAAGADRFFEVGAGDALKKYNRWIEGEIEK